MFMIVFTAIFFAAAINAGDTTGASIFAIAGVWACGRVRRIK